MIPFVKFIAIVAALAAGLVFYLNRPQLRFIRDLAEDLGLLSQQSLIAGTGSMYPTFPKGQSENKLEQIQEVVGSAKARKFPGGIKLFGRKYFDYKLQRGDIVFFTSSKTQKIIEKEFEGTTFLSASKAWMGFVKRVIALPGDTIEIRDGFVKLNHTILKEPYIAQARSTYGGDFLADCQMLTVPENYVFVMGDNRKGSNDSRFEVELVSFDHITSIISINHQDHLKSNWRNTSKDESFANQPTLDPERYLALLNAKRAENNRSPLKYQSKLSLSASKRADVILKFNDFSFEATRSGYSQEKALSEVGYSNITWGEAPTLGYYSEDELIENSFQFPQRKQFLLNGDFQEVGVSVKVGQINNCPVQIVVQHLAGYIPPNYKAADLENIRQVILKLKEILPSWEDLKKHPSFYGKNRDDVDRITSIISGRVTTLEVILKRMAANEWFSAEEKKLLEADKSLAEEQNRIAEKLNSL